MSPDSATFYFFILSVRLCSRFIANAHESESHSPGAGTFSRDLTKTKALQCRDFTWALHMEKSISPLFPGPRGDVVANVWCIGSSVFFSDLNKKKWPHLFYSYM